MARKCTIATRTRVRRTRARHIVPKVIGSLVSFGQLEYIRPSGGMSNAT